MDNPTPSELSGEELDALEGDLQQMASSCSVDMVLWDRFSNGVLRLIAAARNQAPTPVGGGALREAVERVRERADWFAIDAHGHIGQEAREQLAADLRIILAAVALPPAGIEGSDSEIVKGMRLALWVCAEKFRLYEQSHRAKGTPDADAKAVVNAEMATMCDRIIALSQTDAHPPQDHGQVSAQDGSALIKRLRRKLDRWVALWGLLGADSFDGIEQRYREIGDHLANESKLEFGSALERGTAGGGEG